MSNKKKIMVIFVVCALLSTTIALAAGDYQINWWTVDNGGGSSQSVGGQYLLQGSIGQPLTGFSTGGEYILSSGFWHGIGAAIQEFMVHLPMVIR